MRSFRHYAPLLLALLTLAGCGGDDEDAGGGAGARAYPVEVETAEGRSVEYVVRATGSVTAFEEVQITARVAGVVEEIHFREGDKVDEDTVMVEIEPRRFQLELDMAEAARDRAEAELKEVRDGLRRRENPGGEGATGIFSKEEIEAWRTRVAVAEANLKLREAELAEAELNLEYARPKAPMAGDVQPRLVQTGQWVDEGTQIAKIIRRDPMLVRFSVPESDAGSIRPGMTVRFRTGRDSQEYTARIVYIAGAADATTRMRRMTAEVSEEDAPALTPGEYATIRVIVDQRGDAVTVPDTAVSPSERGYIVYVVEDGKGVLRVVKTGLSTPDGRIEIVEGLELGDVVVVRGADALRPGVDVKISHENEAPAPEASP